MTLPHGAPSGRRLTALRLTEFRNYPRMELEVASGLVVLVGANGAGKTNLIEAVSCLAPGRGLRRATTEELAREGGAQAWAVSADLGADGETRAGEDGSVRVGVGQDPSGPSRRLVRIDGKTAPQSELAELVRVAWLTPAQDRVFAGARGERLRFYDRLTLALHPEHGANAARYERALRERVKLLQTGRGDASWLDGLEAEMAERGAGIAQARVQARRALQAAIDARPDGAFPKADLTVSGWLEARLEEGIAQADARAAFAQELARQRRRDAAAGRALTGPHRTDFQAAHRKKAMPAAQCSTGEQKALLVGLALAHARALEDLRAIARPILLLDEAVAHLDGDRRSALADELGALGAQTWLTGTDASLFAAFQSAQMVHVADGVARPL